MKILEKMKYVVAAAILLLLSNIVEANNYSRVNIGYLFYGKSSATDATLQWWGQHTDMCIISTPDPAQGLSWLYSTVRTYNPNMKVIMYQQGEDTGWDHFGESTGTGNLSVTCGSPAAFESTFLHVGVACTYTTGSDKITTNALVGDRFGTYTIDRNVKNIKSSTYRNWWGTFASAQMTSLGADGVMADNWDLLKWHEFPETNIAEYPCPGTYANAGAVEAAWDNDYKGMALAVKPLIGSKLLLPNVSMSATYMGIWKNVLVDGALVETWGPIDIGMDKSESTSGLNRFQSDLDIGTHAVTTGKSLFLIMYSNVTTGFPAGYSNSNADGLLREQSFFLSEYYLIYGPKIYFAYQGADPQTSWFHALETDIGDPTGAYYTFATGTDPSGGGNYKILARNYTKGMVLVKPRPTGTSSYTTNSATTHSLGGTYKIIRADGVVSGDVTTVTLRNSEGVILYSGSGTPAVTNVQPTSGSNLYASTITITGNGFFGGGATTAVSSIKLGDAANTTIITTAAVFSDTLIRGAVIPSGVLIGSYDVKITTPGGTNSTSTQKFGVTTGIPAVTALTPSSGKETAVTTISITGTGFFGGITSSTITAVKISDGIPTALTISSAVITDTTITNAVLPSGILPGTYNIMVFAAGGNNVTSTQKFSVLPVPKVTGLNASTSDNTVSKTITITGAGFFGGKGSNDILSINLSDTSATAITGFTVASDTQITGAVIRPGIKAGTYDVRVTTSVDTNNTSSVKYIVSTPAPSVLSVFPAGNFSNAASCTLTITGSGFTGGVPGGTTTVTLVSVNGTTLTLPGSGTTNTSIPGLIMPASIPAGTYDILVKSLNGNGTGTNLITITTAAPVIFSVLPAVKFNNTGVSTLTISGNNFFAGSGSNAVSAITVNGTALTITGAGISNTTIPGAIMPKGIQSGTYDILVTTSVGTGTGTLLVTINTNVPAVTALTPSSVKETAAATISIAGTGFFGGITSNTVTAVKISDGIPTALTITSAVITDTTITNAVLPSGILPGTYNIMVFAAGGNNVTSTQKFSVLPVPKVTGLNASTSDNTVSKTITITGAGFFGGKGSNDILSINLNDTGTTAITVFTVASDTQITGAVIRPGIKAGTYDVRVATSVDTNNTSAVKYIVSTPAPVILSVTPAAKFDNTASGTLTITGSGFSGGVPGGATTVTAVSVNGTMLTLPGAGITDVFLPGLIMPKGIAVGTYDIILAASNGSVTGTKLITISTATTVISSVAPAGKFNNTAARILTITGNGFFGGLSSSAVSSVTVNGTVLTLPGSGITNTTLPGVIMPKGIPSGTYDINVTAAGITGTGTQLVTINTDVPAVTSLTPSTAPDNAPTGVTITGTGFFGGINSSTVTAVKLDDGTALTGVAVVSDTVIYASVPSGITAGNYNIRVTAAGGTNSTSTSKFTVTSAGSGNSASAEANIPAGSGTVTIEVNPFSGKVQIIMDPGTFSDTMNITLTANPTLPVVDRTTVIPGLGLSITEDKSLQPLKLVKIVINYRDSDVVGIDERKLKIARYDEAHKCWLILATTVFADINRLEAYTDHFSTFGVVELVPASDLTQAKPYPNPFTPGAGANLTFDAVTADAKVTIYTIMGEKIIELTDLDGDGRILWDGKNSNGNFVATGVYFAVAQNTKEAQRIKIAVQR